MKINYKGKNYNLPDFLIVGAAKSGTTSLHYYLKNHEEVFLPEIKESYFFSFFNAKPNFVSPDPLFDVIDGLESYSKQYLSEFNGLMGDASPSYLYAYKKTISNIKEIYGEEYKKLKIIILLRNPIERAWSQYMHFKKNYNEPLDFKEAIREETIKNRLDSNWNYFYDYIGFGMYSNQIKAYQNSFNDVKVFLYEDVKKDSNKLIKDTIDFLNLEYHTNNRDETPKVFNISGVPKNNIYSYFWRLKKIKFIKSIFRRTFPAKFKNIINNFMISRSLQRVEITPENRDLLRDKFELEINTLKNILKREEVNNWN